ncbi:hypothetical protein BDZ45DRAFT_771810 [Acephala macrosclerotiorum]|nr:hypothetical protein BDZ45DRAFT_771810 [Acephala macrosclerotiorum]
MGSRTQSSDSTCKCHDLDVPAYKASKVALNMLAVGYTTRLKEIGAMVNIICPYDQLIVGAFFRLVRHAGECCS